MTHGSTNIKFMTI